VDYLWIPSRDSNLAKGGGISGCGHLMLTARRGNILGYNVIFVQHAIEKDDEVAAVGALFVA
jgi:hypothetical protein